MYMINEVEKVIRIPPCELGDEDVDVVGKLTSETYEGRLAEGDKTFTVLIKNVRAEGPGRIVHGDGAVYQSVKFISHSSLPCPRVWRGWRAAGRKP